jgi:hypothetical protein
MQSRVAAPMAALPPLPGTDWTDHERAEISRLESYCRDLGHWHLECTHTDVGDPFCVVHDQHSDVVVLHIARIDRRYVIDSPARESSVTVPTIEAAIDIAIAELELLA